MQSWPHNQKSSVKLLVSMKPPQAAMTRVSASRRTCNAAATANEGKKK